MKYSILIILTILFSTAPNTIKKPEFMRINRQQTSLKQKAFTVLRNKCNTCHATKKRAEIFTISNMDSLSIDINNQVFIKRKMPKGKKNKLSATEELYLINWLETLN